MNDTELILRIRSILAEVEQDREITIANFLDAADDVRSVLLETWTQDQRDAKPWLKAFVSTLRQRRDDIADRAAADPMILYQPQHSVSIEFHRSLAEVRYYRSGNRCSKTQSGVAEVYWTLTGQHPWRPHPPIPAQVLLVGSNFTKYRPTVFEPKYLRGEGGNPLSPVFPEGGKWFYGYDQKTYTITLGCNECAEVGKAGSCPHMKSSVILFSDTEGAGVMAGSQAALVQLDEQVQYDIYREARERIKTVPNSGVIVTETPIRGKAFWTHQVLTKMAERGDRISNRPIVTIHKIDQFSAGLTPHDRVHASMAEMTEAEIQTRIFGMPAAASELAVFDLEVTQKMRDDITAPELGALRIEVMKNDRDKPESELLMFAKETTPITFDARKDGLLRRWELPMRQGQYVIGADVAHGLTKRDASVASVLRMKPNGLDIDLDMVAQYHGWIDPVRYADELFKLGLHYFPSTLVIERNGPGEVVLKRLKDLGCWFLFQDVGNQASTLENLDTIYGIDTNVRTKSVIVSLLQSVMKLRRLGRESLRVRCNETIDELEAYVQKPSDTGRSFRFEADGDSHDDRVMSLALAVYAVKTTPMYDFAMEKKIKSYLARLGKEADNVARSRKFWEEFRAEEAQARRQLLANRMLVEG